MLGLASDARVFVPLCGKILDLMWLHKRGHDVVGIELSPVAVRDFFKAAHLLPRHNCQGDLTRWTQERLAIYCGEFLALTRDELLGVSAVYDRAALTALPESLRAGYVSHLHAILPGGCLVLLMTIEDLDDDEEAADNMSSAENILSLYCAHFSIELLHAEYHEAMVDRAGEPTDPRCIHKVYRLQHSTSAPNEATP